MRRQVAEDLRIGFGVTQWGNRRAIQQHISVAIRRMNVPMLQLRGGGQDVVGVVSRVSLKMLQHHSKQVIARKALHHSARLRGHSDRVAVVHNQRFNFGAKLAGRFFEQIIANRDHVDRSGRAPQQKVRPL